MRDEFQSELYGFFQSDRVAGYQLSNFVTFAAVIGEELAPGRGEDKSGQGIDLIGGEIAAPGGHTLMLAFGNHLVQINASWYGYRWSMAGGTIFCVQDSGLVTPNDFQGWGDLTIRLDG